MLFNDYLVPKKSSDGTVPTLVSPRRYTLAANTTYYYIMDTSLGTRAGFHVTGYTAGALLTISVQDSMHNAAEVGDRSGTIGEWPTEKPPSAYVSFEGTGWAQGASPGVVTTGGTGAGGATFHVSEITSGRTRLAITTGGTGGDLPRRERSART